MRSANPDKCITVLLPTGCIPKGNEGKEKATERYEEAIEFFRRLRNDTCACSIVLDAETSHYYPAIRGGWEKKNIVLRITTLNTEHIANSNDETDLYMREMGFHEKQNFGAIYMDEPQKSGYPLTIENGVKLRAFHRFVNEVFRTRFIITNYDDFWLSDNRAIYSPYCDEIIDDGYDDDFGVLAYSVFQLESRTLLFSMSNSYPDGVPGVQIDPGKVRKYFEWANALPVTGVWLWFGEYHDCQRFMQDLRIACQEAAKSGWATPKEVFIETGKRFCKFSDCSLCSGASATDDNYWQDEPIGPPCPPAMLEKDVELRTQTISSFIYSHFALL